MLKSQKLIVESFSEFSQFFWKESDGWGQNFNWLINTIVRKGWSHNLLKKAINRKEENSVKEQEAENHRFLELIHDLTEKIEDLMKKSCRKGRENWTIYRWCRHLERPL